VRSLGVRLRIAQVLGPRSPVIVYLDEHMLKRANLGADRDSATWPGGPAVKGGVGREFGRAQQDIVRYGAADK
jgi:hypothetical protein